MSSLDKIFASVTTSPSKRTAVEVATDAIAMAERSSLRLILMQGPVGAGKTTIANEFTNWPHVHCVSADDYFMKSGVYRFNGAQLHEAHASCRQQAEDLLAYHGDGIVVIDNCNADRADAAPYLDLTNGRALIISIVPKNQADAIRCAKRSVHRVPNQASMRTYRKLETLAANGIVIMNESVKG